MQEYQTKYEKQKRVYKDKVDEFLVGLGGQEEQDTYLSSLADYKAKRRAYLKHFRLKKLGLVKVHGMREGERERERERKREVQIVVSKHHIFFPRQCFWLCSSTVKH